MDKRGYGFTITIVVISALLVSSLVFYTQTYRSRVEDTSTRITVDKVHDFVEDVKRDLGRAAEICAKRAVVYAINDAKERAIAGDPALVDYTYRKCTDFEYDGNGSQAAVVELMLCGTLDGVKVDSMANNSLEDWRMRVEDKGRQLDLVTDVAVRDVEIPLYDPWHFAVIVYINLNVSDEKNPGSYEGYSLPVLSMVSIVGLEDPLYQAYLADPRVPNVFHPCNLTSFREFVGSGGLGYGLGGGMVSYLANLTVVEQKNRVNNYNVTVVESRGVNVSIGVLDTVFVIDMDTPDVLAVKDKLNQSAGVIDYTAVNMSGPPLNMTVTYVSNIPGVLDLGDGDWVAINGTNVFKVYLNELVDTGCYVWDR